MVRVVRPPLPALNGGPALEHGFSSRRGHHCHRRDWHRGGICHRADEPARAPGTVCSHRVASSRPRLRDRVGLDVPGTIPSWPMGRLAGAVAGPLPARLPPCGGQLQECGSRSRGGLQEPRSGPLAHILVREPAQCPPGPAWRLPARRPLPPGRVRGVRDPPATRPSPRRSSPSSRWASTRRRRQPSAWCWWP